MRNQIAVEIPDAAIDNRQSFAQLHQGGGAIKRAGGGLVHEVDVQIGRHGVFQRPDMGKNAHIGAYISQRKHGRAAHRAARAQMAVVGRQPQHRSAVFNAFDRKHPAILVDLRKFLIEKPLHIGNTHDWLRDVRRHRMRSFIK